MKSTKQKAEKSRYDKSRKHRRRRRLFDVSIKIYNHFIHHWVLWKILSTSKTMKITERFVQQTRKNTDIVVVYICCTVLLFMARINLEKNIELTSCECWGGRKKEHTTERVSKTKFDGRSEATLWPRWGEATTTNHVKERSNFKSARKIIFLEMSCWKL